MKTIKLRKSTLVLSFGLGLFFQAHAADVWISDEIEAPLRETPELNANIINMLPAGQRVSVVKKKGEYVKIKAANGAVGWLSDYYILNSESVHEQIKPLRERLATAESQVESLGQELSTLRSQNSELANTKSELERTSSEVKALATSNQSSAEKYANENELLKNKLSEQSEKMSELARALDVAKQKASTVRSRYLSLVKVSENAVEIDRQNQFLQENSVKLEQEMQTLKNDNQTMKAQLDNRQRWVTGLLIFGGLIAGYVLSVLMPPSRRSGSDFSSF